MLLTGAAQACNLFWQVGSSATIGTATTFTGNILARTSISLTTGATIDRRALARTARVPVRRRPSGTASRVADLRYQTEDGSLEVYPVLESRIDGSGRTWLAPALTRCSATGREAE